MATTKTVHRYAAIEHRVIDSPAYADLSYSAQSLLVVIVRQLTKPNNNGHLQATFSYMRRFGFSENTLRRAISQLITHGIICRTRSGGYNPTRAAQYAVTWLPITNKKGIFVDAFESCAWKYWEPAKKKIVPSKLRVYHPQNGGSNTTITPKNEGVITPKFEDTELFTSGIKV